MTSSPLLCHWCSRGEVGARRSVPDHLDQLGRRRSWQRAPAFSFEAVGFYLVHALIVDFRFRSVRLFVGGHSVRHRGRPRFDADGARREPESRTELNRIVEVFGARHRRRSVHSRQRRRFPTQPNLVHRAKDPRQMLLLRKAIRLCRNVRVCRGAWTMRAPETSPGGGAPGTTRGGR